MNSLLFVGLYIGTMSVTGYQSLARNTDASPWITSTGERTSRDGVAVSWDLLCGACRKTHKRCQHPEYEKKLHYGDWLYVNGEFRRVFDLMNKRHKQSIDLWCSTKAEESNVYNTYKNKRGRVWKINRKKT